MTEKQKTAVVALSGGLDSSVTALLLKQKGYEVLGVTGKMFDSPASEMIIQNAQNVAKTLGIEHVVYDATSTFKKEIIDNFLDSYKCGETPNPCILCNKLVKWGKLFNFALKELHAHVFATGHYANILEKDGVFKLYPANDEHKDQLYFLYKLGQHELSKTIFPLANYKKSAVREIAERYNLPSKSSKESQDICFIPKPMTAKKYLFEHLHAQKGDFVDIETGKKLGEHDGYFQYTIGQRKGIGIAHAHPLYVLGTDTKRNIVYVGKEEFNRSKTVFARNINLCFPLADKEFEALVKIRYNMSAKPAHIKIENNIITANFYDEVNSVTTGQSLVIYDLHEGFLIGGGVIFNKA